MSDTVCVLALDAADYELVRRWDCQNILLNDHQAMETYAHSKDEPYTPEVWATVATGAPPEEHGIGETRQEVEWDNPLLRAGSHVTQHLPPRWRQLIGRPFRRRGATQTFVEVADGVDHPFDATLSWPGLGEAKHGELREQCERLVILSDHGMQTTATDDVSPGSHSWRSFVAVQGVMPPLPHTVHDVRSHLEVWAPDGDESGAADVSVDTPTETLENLGYIES